MDEPVLPQSSSHTDGDAKMDAISDHRPFKKPRLTTRPSNSRRLSFTSYGMHLPAQHSTAVVPSSELCTDPADDATVSTLLSELNYTLNATLSSTLNATLSSTLMATLSRTLMATLSSTLMAPLTNTFKATLSDAFEAKNAAHEAAMARRTAAWQAAVGTANRRLREADEKLEKERQQHLAHVSSNERCHDQLANTQLAAEQSARDAHAINSSKDGRLAELGSDSEWEADLIVNGITILNTEGGHMTKEQELKLRDQICEILSHAREIPGSVRTGSALHETTPASRASQTSDTDSIHPEQPSTSARTDEHTYSFDGFY